MHRSYRTRQLLLVLCLILAAAPAFAQATQTRSRSRFSRRSARPARTWCGCRRRRPLVDKMLDMAKA